MKRSALLLGLALTVLPALTAAPAEAYYYRGHHWRYRHNGGYYNYRYNGGYWRYHWNGGYYNYRYNGAYWRYRWNGGYYNYHWRNRYYRDRYRCEVHGWCYR